MSEYLDVYSCLPKFMCFEFPILQKVILKLFSFKTLKFCCSFWDLKFQVKNSSCSSWTELIKFTKIQDEKLELLAIKAKQSSLNGIDVT